MKEEISLNVVIESLLGVYSNPHRDKRFHTVSVVYICKANGMPIAADDAKEVMIVPLEKLNLDRLVFDHGDILRDYLQKRNEVL